jgi:hypothetical protein
MLRTTLLASMAAVLATLSTSAIASAHEHHRYHHQAYASDNGLIVDGNQDDNDENDADVVSVAEPVYYAPVQTSYVATQTAYVPANDTIVTPYGYNPVYNNGYYQGYGYNPQYAYNPYYAGAAYGQGDPVSSAVVNTVLAAASNGGHVDGQTLIQSLVGGYLAAQAQQQYQQQYQQPVYQQPVYQQPVYQQVYQQQQPVYYPQPARVIRVYQQHVAPVQYAPAYYVRGHRGEERGNREHGDGEHGGGDHGDHGDNG